MQTQLPSGAHNDEEAFQSAEMNAVVDNDGLLPREFTTSDADDDDDGNNDEAEAAVEPRYGYWSSNKNKCLAALIVVTAVVCIFAVGTGIKTAYDSKRSNAVGVQTAYGNYGPVAVTSATRAPKSKSSKTPKSSSKAPKSKSSKAPKSKSSKAPTSAPTIPCPV